MPLHRRIGLLTLGQRVPGLVTTGGRSLEQDKLCRQGLNLSAEPRAASAPRFPSSQVIEEGAHILERQSWVTAQEAPQRRPPPRPFVDVGPAGPIEAMPQRPMILPCGDLGTIETIVPFAQVELAVIPGRDERRFAGYRIVVHIPAISSP